ncbi:MAG: TetR family transcriptional regulator [Microbacterium sp.]|jgi:DNA-binding transcriptional regulator YbjK|nr:TetR family transcriptional regulator [Microbacterium sp.]
MTNEVVDRRERILSAALDDIVEVGVHRVTHRSIAARASVSPGSLTYHFGSLDEIFEGAFQQMYTAMAREYRSRFEKAGSVEEAIEVVVDLIEGAGGDDLHTRALFEMYSYGSFNPTVRSYCAHWMTLSRQALQLQFSEATARTLDALHEGWSMHRYFEGRPLDRHLVRKTVKAVVELG